MPASNRWPRTRVDVMGPVFLRGAPVEEYVANAITQILEHRD
jgi:hypothetical protein